MILSQIKLVEQECGYNNLMIEIRTADDLNNVRNDLSGEYIQMTDINLLEYDNWNPIGSYESPFTGSYDGRGYRITNLAISRSEENNIGLFSFFSEARILNVNISGNIVGGDTIGSLVAGSTNGTVIDRCCADINIAGSGDSIGGLVGANVNSIIRKSYTIGNIYTSAGSNCGGIVGVNAGTGAVDNCYSITNIFGDNCVGGAIGGSYSGSEVTNIYFAGNVDGNTNIGGLLGVLYGTLFSSYYDTETSGQSDNDGRGIPKTTSEMKQQSTFLDWNFINTWNINLEVNDGYPYLLPNITVYKDFDSRQLIYADPPIITFTSQEFDVVIFEEEWITASTTNGFLEILNYENVGCLPIITLTIGATYNNNPKLRFYNGSIYKDISLGTSIGVNDSPIVINSIQKYAKKNSVYFLANNFPRVGFNEYFSIEFRNAEARVEVPINVYYKYYDDTMQLLMFRGNVTLQNKFNQIDLSKKYYNSLYRDKYTISKEVNIDLNRNIIDDNINQIVNSNSTYRIELIGINEDDSSQKIYKLGNVTLNNLNVNIPESDLVTDKITGTGVLL